MSEAATVLPELHLAGDIDRWLLENRGPRNPLNVAQPYAFSVEEERAESGHVEPVLTVFLTNRECPWRCIYCGLWKNTLTDDTPAGAIPAQIDFALRNASQRGAKQIKLYNAGSFFDRRAIPPEDHLAIAERVSGFECVIVECHPALVDDSAVAFRDKLRNARQPGKAAPVFEVAMGLEIADDDLLRKLNKRMTLAMFARAAAFLRANEIAVRAFVMVKPPFVLNEAAALEWAKRSIDFAFECGATVVSLIPSRGGNGAMDALAAAGLFAPPNLSTLEAAQDYGVGLRRGRVFADLWDLDQFSNCAACFPARKDRLRHVNLSQAAVPREQCAMANCISIAGNSTRRRGGAEAGSTPAPGVVTCAPRVTGEGGI